VDGSVFTGSLTGACSGGLPGPVSGVAVSGTFVVLSSGIHVYLLIFDMKKGARLFIRPRWGGSSFLAKLQKYRP